MRIVSTTLTGNAQEAIGDALASVVDVVDACIVIDTGARDASLEVARSVAKDKYVEGRFPWCDDFAAARNFALDAATELGTDWAITVDTDERVDWRGESLRGVLASRADIGCWLMMDAANTYSKERIFRLPPRVRFAGPVHETFPSYEVGAAVLSRARFQELPKTAEQSRAKAERDARVLAEWSRAHPTDARWLYYLGDALQHLGRHVEAIDAYERCAALRGWNEEAAWACYRAAECWCARGRWTEAVESCACGLSHHAGIAELAWLAGYASWRKGELDQAIVWSRSSVAMGCFEGFGATVQRIGFRYPPALYEGPFDVLRYALRAKGDNAGSLQARLKYQRARNARQLAAASPARGT
jgi:hypothetical protein